MRDDAASGLACPLLRGRQLDGITISPGATAAVSHGLRRVPLGFLLGSVTSGTGQCPTVSKQDASTITFSNPGASTIVFSGWVY